MTERRDERLLDNPVWSALQTHHSDLAIGDGRLMRYPSDVTPFVAVESRDVDVSESLPAFVSPGETFYFLGVCPRLDAHWEVRSVSEVIQFLADGPIAAVETRSPELLGPADRELMFAFAKEFYPPFFRARTSDLGAYFGFRTDGLLVALGGERMKIPGFQEISTLCTRPGYTRRGYAVQILLALVGRSRERSERLFGHTVKGNDGMVALLNAPGCRIRGVLPMWQCRRSPC